MSSNNRKIFKATFIVMLVTFISRFLGMIRDGLVFNSFGAGSISDAYYLAVGIPENVFGIIGLAISTTFIPILSEVLHKKGKEEQVKFSRNIITIIFVISLILFFLGMIYTEEIVIFFKDTLSDEEFRLAVRLTKIGMVNIIFLCLNGAFASMLQVAEDFVIPGMLGLFFNIPIILYLLVTKNPSIEGLTIANVAGNMFRVLVQIPSLKKNGFSLKPYINLRDERLQTALIILGPVIIGAGANSINMVVDTKLAYGLGPANLTALTAAQRILMFVNTAIATSIITIMFPILANKLNSGDNKGFNDGLLKALTTIMLLLIPCGVAMIVLNKEIISVTAQYGEFKEDAMILASTAMIGYGIQLPFFGMRDILNVSLFSMKKTKITATNGVIGVIVNIICSVTLSRYFGLAGIAIGSAIAAAVTAILMLRSTNKIVVGFDVKIFSIKMFKLTLAATIMGLIVFVAKDMLSNYSINKFLILMIYGAIGAPIYFVLCKILKVEEVDDTIALALNKIKRK